MNDNVNILVTFKKSPTVGPDPENPDGNAPDIKILNPKQAFVYNGKPQAFTLTTSPENALEGATISYTLDGVTVNEPTDAGIYDVIITSGRYGFGSSELYADWWFNHRKGGSFLQIE